MPHPTRAGTRSGPTWVGHDYQRYLAACGQVKTGRLSDRSPPRTTGRECELFLVTVDDRIVDARNVSFVLLILAGDMALETADVSMNKPSRVRRSR